MKLKELYKFLRQPIQYIIHHSRVYNQLSQQYTDEVNKNKGLNGKNKEFGFQVEQLNRGLIDLNNANTSLKAELKKADAKNNAYRRKFLRYRNEVKNSEKLKQEKVKVNSLSREKAELEERVSRLIEKVSGFDVIYRQQKKIIFDLHKVIETAHKESRKEHESSLKQDVENDEEQSYVIIGGSGRIIASTLTFRRKFNFDNPKDPIDGKMYFRVLRPQKDAPDYQEKGKYVYDIKQAFRDAKKVTLETTIVDGKGEEKIIQFTKLKPTFIKIVKRNQSGEKLTVKDYFYTKVEVYDIGKWERIKEGATTKFKKILHIKNGEPKELHEYVEKRAVQRKQDEENEEKEYSKRMAEVYAGLICCDPKTWNVEEFQRIEKEEGKNLAERLLCKEYSKKKNELLGEIITWIIKHKS